MTAGSLWQGKRAARAMMIGAAVLLLGTASALAADPIKIGQVAALSGASAQSGEAITRGLMMAIDEINAKGGLLGGRMLELVQRDDESSPPKGLIAARELISENVAAIFGGIDTPVSMAMVPVAQQGAAHLYGRVGGGNGDHAQRRQSQLRLPRFRGRRSGRCQAAQIRASEVRRKESRA